MINKPKLTIKDGQALVTEFYKSGLKLKEFSTQKNIPYHILQYWRDRCEIVNKSKTSNDAKFLPVNLVQSTIKVAPTKVIPIKITVNDRIIIELPKEVDLLQFKKVLEVCVACG